MLASFLGVLPILTPPLCALAFIMCSKSNPLVVFWQGDCVYKNSILRMFSEESFPKKIIDTKVKALT
jgi:hypothetical protein